VTRYRRKKLSRGDSAAAAVTSTILGIGTAALAFYVTRLFLSREPLAGGGGVLAAGAEPSGALPPGDESAPEADGHDPGE
jgi:hypothetical protein